MIGCDLRLASENALDAHLFAEHAEAGFYLVVNEQIAQPRMALTEPCRRLEIRTLGRDPIDLELELLIPEEISSLRPLRHVNHEALCRDDVARDKEANSPQY